MDTAENRQQVLEPSHLYSLPEAMARTGLSKSAFRQARRNGLPVLYFSTRAFVHGQRCLLFIYQTLVSHRGRRYIADNDSTESSVGDSR